MILFNCICWCCILKYERIISGQYDPIMMNTGMDVFLSLFQNARLKKLFFQHLTFFLQHLTPETSELRGVGHQLMNTFARDALNTSSSQSSCVEVLNWMLRVVRAAATGRLWEEVSLNTHGSFKGRRCKGQCEVTVNTEDCVNMRL